MFITNNNKLLFQLAPKFLISIYRIQLIISFFLREINFSLVTASLSQVNLKKEMAARADIVEAQKSARGHLN